MPDKIQIFLENTPQEIKAGISLLDFVKDFSENPQAIATAVNGEFVPRERRGECILKSGDKVLFFRQIVGG